jgi:hypothetical protein
VEAGRIHVLGRHLPEPPFVCRDLEHFLSRDSAGWYLLGHPIRERGAPRHRPSRHYRRSNAVADPNAFADADADALANPNPNALPHTDADALPHTDADALAHTFTDALANTNRYVNATDIRQRQL